MDDKKLKVISSLLDTFFPSIPLHTTIDDPAIQSFYSFKGSDFQGLSLKVLDVIQTQLDNTDRKDLLQLLYLLNTRIGTLLLAGKHALSPYLLPMSYPDLPLHSRERTLLSWSSSSHTQLRKAFKGLKSLLLSLQLSWNSPPQQAALAPSDMHACASPLFKALLYDVQDPSRPLSPMPSALQAETKISSRLVDLSSDIHQSASAAAAAFLAKGLQVVWPGQGSSFWWKDRDTSFVVLCDAVVVGSGAGGGVAAERLSSAGLSVVVLEKATFVRAGDMPATEAAGFESMYERGGMVTTENGAMTVLAGSTLGGGTRINWNASFETPHHVRQEWSCSHGLADFTGLRYDRALHAVTTRLKVHTGFAHGRSCTLFAAGLQACDYDCEEVPRNCLNDAACSGHCCFGCRHGAKQDSVNAFLADACSPRRSYASATTTVVTGVYADMIYHVQSKPDQRPSSPAKTPRPRQVVGIYASSPTLKILFVAPRVFCCAGAIHTPALLLRSGIRGNGQVGAHLRLHPCTVVLGLFSPPGTGRGAVECWRGPIMSIYSRQAADWNGSGYGCMLYTPASHPGLFAAALPWRGGREYKDLLLQYPHGSAVLVLVRDTTGGRILLDGQGNPRVRYTMSDRDRGTMIKGMQLGLRALAAAGAETLMTLHKDDRGLIRLDGDSETLEGYVERTVPSLGVVDLDMATFSAHQMGTARMGMDAGSSVVDDSGESWEVSGVYCCDASVFPTALGINPMISVQAIAYMVCDGVLEREAKTVRSVVVTYENVSRM